MSTANYTSSDLTRIRRAMALAAFNTANAAAVNAGTSVQREQATSQTLDVVVARNQGICYCNGEGLNRGAPGCGCNITR